MADRVAEWVDLVESLYPPSDAESWDNVGLQVGDPDDEVQRVLVCLDVTEATLAEAAENDVQLLVAHHPLLFRPLQRVAPDSAAGRLTLRAARLGLSVLAAHTNFDAAADGTTAPTMQLLGLGGSPLVASPSAAEQVKIVVFTPAEATGAVLSAAFTAGAGQIGEYDECSFRVSGTGTFRPSSSANPAVGQRDQRNDVAEERIEVVVGRPHLQTVVDAIRAAHPYEEVALDVFATIDVSGGATKGLGRVADLDEPRRLGDIAALLRDRLPSPHLRMAGDPDRLVRRVAACGGAGDSLIAAALAAGADLFITGDLRHHVTLDALTMGMVLIDAGHHATEVAALPAMVTALRARAEANGLTARLIPSATSTDPWSTTALWEERQG